MQRIIDWFSGSKDYYEGVAIYATLPIKKTRTLRTLNKGKSRRNMSLLVAELRKYKNGVTKAPTQKKETPTPPQSKKTITQETINIAVNRTAQKQESLHQEFSGVRIGDLPAALRPRYSKARRCFEQMIELKFALNDLPASAESDALAIMLQIDDLDAERDLIWKELNHYKTFRTILPSTEKDYSKISDLEKDKIRRNLESSKSKMQKRVDDWYNELEKETDKHQQKLIENKINKAEKAIHQKNININHLKSLL